MTRPAKTAIIVTRPDPWTINSGLAIDIGGWLTHALRSIVYGAKRVR